jgi:Fatty acid hydroxylase superfamily
MAMVRRTLAGLGAGWGLWTAAEYAMHRWAMHGRWRQQPVAAEHLRHHADPLATDAVLRSLSYLPVAVGAIGLGAAARHLGGPDVGRDLGRGVGVAFMAGYAAYEQLHWRAHHRHPGNPLESWLQRRHLVHHRRAGRNYGVTTSIWDHVLGTAAPGTTGPPSKASSPEGPSRPDPSRTVAA